MLNANVNKMFTLALEYNLPIMFTVRTVHYDCYMQVAIMENFDFNTHLYDVSQDFQRRSLWTGDCYGQADVMFVHSRQPVQ